MILIEYGENKELFITDAQSVPEAIKELYRYVGGGIGEDLFCEAVDGIAKSSVGSITRFYNALACETPIHQIFTGATQYWRANNDGKRP